ncbi:MAG: hypothetical protein ACH34X_00095 [Thiolinea sp.]
MGGYALGIQDYPRYTGTMAIWINQANLQLDNRIVLNTLASTLYLSPEEYLYHENERDDHGEKCEYVNDLVYSMAGASRNHNRTAGTYLCAYVLCSQDSPLIEIYRWRTEWVREVFTSGQSFKLESVGLELTADEIYYFLDTA